MISSAVCSWKDNTSVTKQSTVSSSHFNSAEISIHIPSQSLELWCECRRLTYKASSAVLSPNDFTKASSFYLFLYFSCFSSLWHHWHKLLASLLYRFFLLSFLDNAFLHSSHNSCFIILIYLGKNKALSMLGRNMSSNNAEVTYRKSQIIFCCLQVCETVPGIPCIGFLEKNKKAQYQLEQFLRGPA